MHEYMTAMIALAGAICGIVLMVFLLKKTMPSRFTGVKHLQIVDQLSFGSKERAYLLKINDALILVGVTPHGMSTLHVCPPLEPDQKTPL